MLFQEGSRSENERQYLHDILSKGLTATQCVMNYVVMNRLYNIDFKQFPFMPELSGTTMMRAIACLIGLLSMGLNPAQASLSELKEAYLQSLSQLDVPPLQLDVAAYLNSIDDASELIRQERFFVGMAEKVRRLDRETLSADQLADVALLEYEVNLHQQRISLERKHIDMGMPALSDAKLAGLANGRDWYAYLLKKWVAAEVTPEEIFNFGLVELAQAQQAIKRIHQQINNEDRSIDDALNAPDQLTDDEQKVVAKIKWAKARVMENMPRLFPRIENMPQLKIARGSDANLSQVPGFYRDNTFYFNLFEKPFKLRQIDWLFIHEAIPGHHFQVAMMANNTHFPFRRHFNYPGFNEGWAAYTESLGKQLGLYQSLETELARWEWDIVRSVRVSLDVGLNYYGWSDEKALAFWQEHVQDQDDIAMREIDRMRRWPAQVVTYKYGADRIEQWQEKMRGRSGNAFSLKRFHYQVLSHGSLPFDILEVLLFQVGSGVFSR